MHFTPSANIHELFRANWIVCKKGEIFNPSQFLAVPAKTYQGCKVVHPQNSRPDWKRSLQKTGFIGEKGV